MDFYALLSEHYDEIFKSSETKLDFLSEGLRKSDRILDVGAATGTFSLPMAKRGYQVYATDIEGAMVLKMKEKAEEIENHKAAVLGMESISKVSGYGPFKLIYCIGNTIVHLASHEEMKKFISDAKELLYDEGSLIIQTVNYDRILDKLDEDEVFDFAQVKLENGRVFKRNYRYSDDVFENDRKKVIFEGSIDDKKGHTLLTPVKSNELMRMVLEAGFSRANIYGNFDMSDYSYESPAIVLKAVK